MKSGWIQDTGIQDTGIQDTGIQDTGIQDTGIQDAGEGTLGKEIGYRRKRSHKKQRTPAAFAAGALIVLHRIGVGFPQA